MSIYSQRLSDFVVIDAPDPNVELMIRSRVYYCKACICMTNDKAFVTRHQHEMEIV
jgi:hypothetical protein